MPWVPEEQLFAMLKTLADIEDHVGKLAAFAAKVRQREAEVREAVRTLEEALR